MVTSRGRWLNEKNASRQYLCDSGAKSPEESNEKLRSHDEQEFFARRAFDIQASRSATGKGAEGRSEVSSLETLQYERRTRTILWIPSKLRKGVAPALP